MRPTEIDFSADDICNIINACKESGVTRLTLGSLQVTFGTTPGAADPRPFMADPSLPPQSDKTGELQLTVGDEIQLQEAYYAQQLIDDPSGFESTIIDGFIEKERVEDEDS